MLLDVRPVLTKIAGRQLEPGRERVCDGSTGFHRVAIDGNSPDLEGARESTQDGRHGLRGVLRFVGPSSLNLIDEDASILLWALVRKTRTQARLKAVDARGVEGEVESIGADLGARILVGLSILERRDRFDLKVAPGKSATHLGVCAEVIPVPAAGGPSIQVSEDDGAA